MHRVMEGLPMYCGSMFEVLVGDLIRRGRILCDRHFTRIGRWWYKEAEIDCIALDDESRSIIFCECKWQDLSAKEARTVLNNLVKKSEGVRWHDEDRKEEYCLVARKIAGKDRLKSDGFLVYDLEDLMTLPQ
jgi:AAA+ ATPase superfamily predicted ATPase